MTVMGKQFHAAERLVRLRAARNPNDVIEEAETLGERIADVVASFGGSWTFIMAFAVVLAVYSAINVELGSKAWDPYPFILLNLFLSMLAAIQAPIIMMRLIAAPVILLLLLLMLFSRDLNLLLLGEEEAGRRPGPDDRHGQAVPCRGKTGPPPRRAQPE